MKKRALVAALVAGALGLMTAAPASAAPTDRTVVDAWYRDFLGRPADDPGADHWVGRIASSSPADALWSMTRTREYAVHEVGQYYILHLQRGPDAGAAYWVDGAAAGRFPLEWAEQNVLASAEYASLWARVYGSNDRRHLAEAWYNTLLERRASAGEAAYWAARIDRIGRLGALREIWYSDEAVRQRIQRHYRELLGRDADGGGVSYWFGREVQSDLDVQVLIAATPEYRSRDRS